MSFITDQALRASFPQAGDIPADQILQATADADGVYDMVNQNPNVTVSDLRAWGEQNGIDPTRMNLALELLENTGRLYQLPAGVTPPPPADNAPSDPSANAALLTDAFTATELRNAARRVGADIAKSAGKPELAAAILDASQKA